jgi:threonine synthase
MVNSKAITFGEKIDVCVPTGNFGNIFAAYIAKLMGLPIEKLVCASNVNNVLTDFLESGTYDKNRSFHATISPSMDILISSNLERLLFTVSGQEKTAKYMTELNTLGKYTVDDETFEKIKESFIGIYTDENETKNTILSTYKNKNYLIDTHTSVAMKAAQRYLSDYEAERKVLVVSTASPYKFANDVYESLTSERMQSDTEAPKALSDFTGTEIPAPLSSLCEKAILHSDTIGKEDMDKAVTDFVKA